MNVMNVNILRIQIEKKNNNLAVFLAWKSPAYSCGIAYINVDSNGNVIRDITILPGNDPNQ